MAEAVATPTKTFVNKTGKVIEIYGTLAVDASPATYATGGIACSLGTILEGSTLAGGFIEMHIEGQAGYLYRYIASTAKLMIRQCAAASNPQAELSVAAIPAGVSGDTIKFKLMLKQFN